MSQELILPPHSESGFDLVRKFKIGFEVCMELSSVFADCEQIPDSFYPKKYSRTKEETAIATKKFALALAYGAMIGLQPQQCARWLYPVNGITTLYGEGVVFQIRRAPGFVYLKDHAVIEDGKTVGHTVTAKRGNEEVTFTYTRKMAEIAGLWPTEIINGAFFKKTQDGRPFQDGWCKNPGDMLFYKALSRVAKRLFPDMLGGTPLKEDMEGVFEETIPSETVTEIFPDTDIEKNISEILTLSSPETQIATLKELAKQSTTTGKTRILQVIQEIEDKLATQVVEVIEAMTPAEVVESAEVVEKSENPTIPETSKEALAAHAQLLTYLKDETVTKFFTQQEVDDFTICEVSAAPTLLVEMQTLAKQGNAFLKVLQKTKVGNARSMLAIKPENIRWIEFPWAKELLEEKVI